MSTIDYYQRILEHIKGTMQEQDLTLFANMKVKIEAIKEAFSSDRNMQRFALICDLILKETETRRAEDLGMLELILGLISDHFREISALKDVILPLVSERRELADKIEKIEESLQQREKILDELEKAIEERRKFYEEHK